jgi:hypothetical protein
MKYGINRKKSVFGPHNIDTLSVLFGALLGDAYGETRLGKSRIVFQQENKNQEYLCWLHQFFASRGYCNEKIPKISIRIAKQGKIRQIIRFRTYSFESLNWVIECFYLEKLKRVPSRKELNKLLTPLALAVWISDDGSPCGKGLKISTNCFTIEEIQRLCDALYDLYGIYSKPNKHGFSKENKQIQYCLYIYKQSMGQVVLLVRPFMVKSMYYKLGIRDLNFL